VHGFFKPGVLALSVVIGLFCWFYPARVVCTLVVSLREQEFVEAAHMVGARNGRIIRKHLAEAP
jgi:ABC-type dipeptide/oligopeptide/nickel transport system permease subunit